MNQDFGKIKTHFDQHGWVLIKGLFEKAEIEKIREEALESSKEIGNKPIDLLSDKRVSHVLSDKRVTDVAKALLATDKLVYFGDSSISLGNLGQGFHKDNPDRFKPTGADWATNDYPILRMGLYCQDHSKHSGALALRDKSHNYTDGKKGKPFFVPTEPGDLIVWNLRTTHSGNSMRLKLLPEMVIDTRLYRYLPAFMFKKEEKLRVALFMTFGKEAPLLQRNLQYLKERTYMVEIWRNSNTPAANIEKLEARGVDFVDMHAEAMAIDLAKTNRHPHNMDN